MNFDISLREAKPFGEQYYAEVKDLLNKLDSKNAEEQCELFKEFSKNFTILPPLWIYWFKAECIKNGLELHSFLLPLLNQIYGFEDRHAPVPASSGVPQSLLRYVGADSRGSAPGFLDTQPPLTKKKCTNDIDKFESVNFISFANLDCDDLVYNKKKLHDTLNMEYHKLKKKHLYIGYSESQLRHIFKNIEIPNREEIKYLKEMLPYPHLGLPLLHKTLNGLYLDKYMTSPKVLAFAKIEKNVKFARNFKSDRKK